MKDKTDWKNLFLNLFVVFLGVTMGFVLNNWSEGRKKDKQALIYKQSLLEDININIKELNIFIEDNKKWINNVETLLDHIESNPSAKIDSLQTVLNFSTTVNTISIQKSTFESLKNSGDMNLISNLDLRTNLVKYYSGSVYKVEFAEQYMLNFLNNNIIPLVLKTYDRYEGAFLNPKKDATRYINNLISFYVGKQQLVANYSNLLEHSKVIKQKLKNIED